MLTTFKQRQEIRLQKYIYTKQLLYEDEKLSHEITVKGVAFAMVVIAKNRGQPETSIKQ